MNPTIRRATIEDADAIAPLFDHYRMFYQQLAEVGGKVVGFTQLFPSFSSVRAGRAWVLNDLYVDIAARRLGVARALLQAATDFARADGAIRLELETDPDNRSAQALYRHMGWEPYEGTLRFRLSLKA
jgi:GNAT superfamily N-acetyltransferase